MQTVTAKPRQLDKLAQVLSPFLGAVFAQVDCRLVRMPRLNSYCASFDRRCSWLCVDITFRAA